MKLTFDSARLSSLKATIAAILVCGLLTVEIGTAAAAQFGKLIYTIPSGWKQEKINGSLALYPQASNSLAASSSAIFISPIVEYDGSDREFFSRLVAALEEAETAIDRSEIQTLTGAKTSISFQTSITRDADGRQNYRIYAIARSGNRIEPLTLISKSDSEVESAIEIFRDFALNLQIAPANLAVKMPASLRKIANSHSGKNCRTIVRQQTYFIPTGGVQFFPVPQRVCS